ncbi:hypothetical protein [Limnoglobus roseus]|uniref:Uncharacterized protein n=1 Tax=Limnoglobus roseus TaxID=2598579 RepID=A0A5C1ADI1_9BACT|nr:hypothetical protein [Limnoglobus roseus]QEL17419.1 hypothetical protein PX52LOC_04408 [Limnoglobus roseus]
MRAALKKAIRPAGPTTPAELEFVDLLRQADKLRHDLMAFTSRPDHEDVVFGLMSGFAITEPDVQLYVNEVVDALCSTAFNLRAFRLMISSDFGSGTWFDKTECRG